MPGVHLIYCLSTAYRPTTPLPLTTFRTPLKVSFLNIRPPVIACPKKWRTKALHGESINEQLTAINGEPHTVFQWQLAETMAYTTPRCAILVRLPWKNGSPLA